MAYTKHDIKQILDINAEDAFNYQQRRHQDWRENYDLYRDKVFYNRLTQRQSVNIPLMKYILKTSLKEIDDPVDLYFRNKDNDKQKEIFINAYWEQVKKDQKIDVKDTVDKKQELQYGRTTTSWNIENGKMIFQNDDALDIFFDRYCDPTDIDGTFRYIEQRHVFTPLKTIEKNPMYDRHSIGKLKTFYSTEGGIVRSAENTESWRAKNERAQDMGVVDITAVQLGETIVELNLHWIKLWSDDIEQEEIYFAITCDAEVLYWGRQEDVIGETADHYWRSHCIKTSWAGDVERNDMYSDALADMIRQINKVVNAWFSQDVENRSLRNYKMNYFNSSLENFFPQTFEAIPWGWYPIPVPAGQKIGDVVMPVDIEPLTDTLPALQFAIGIAEKASAASATSAGQVNQNKVTLGEVELTLSEAKERLKASSNYFIPAWEERGTKFVKLIEAAGDRLDAVRVFKKGYRGNMFSKEIAPSDWQTANGYEVEVSTKADVKNRAIETVNTLNAVRQAMPNNIPLMEIHERKMLDLVPGLTPDEIREVTDFQKKQREAMAKQAALQANAMASAAGGGAAPGGLPGQPPLPNGVPQQQLPAVAGG